MYILISIMAEFSVIVKSLVKYVRPCTPSMAYFLFINCCVMCKEMSVMQLYTQITDDVYIYIYIYIYS